MSENLPEVTAEALHRAVRDLGRRVGESPDRVRAVLSDALGATAREHRSEIDALALASEEGIPSTLMGREESMLTESDVALDDGRLRARLVERGLSDGAADYAIGAWAAALGSVSTLSATGGLTSAMSGPSVGSVSDPATELPEGGVGAAGVGAAGAAALGAGALGAVAASAGEPDAATDADGILGFATAGDDPPRHRRVVPVGRKVMAGSAAAVLAIVAGAVWFSTTGDSADRTTLTDSALRKSTTTTGTPSSTTTKPTTASAAPVTTVPPVITAAPTAAPARTSGSTPSRSSSSTTPKRSTSSTPAKVSSTTRKSTAPPPPPPAPKTLKAGNTSAAWTPKYYEDGINACVDFVPPNAAGNICEAKLNVVKGGTVTTWSIINASSVNGHGSVRISGHQILYTPHHNGYFTDTVRYRLYGGGVTSNWATIAITVYCNDQMGCWG